MNQEMPLTGPAAYSRSTTLPAFVTEEIARTLTEERLPFTVRAVSSQDELSKAVQIRHAAYARHLPEFAEQLKLSEPEDTEDGVVVLLAESKLDSSPLGTMRIQTNQFKPLCVEESVSLPTWLAQSSLAEATRLGVTNERSGRLVTTVLFKAYFQYCLKNRIEWMVITARPPVDRMYSRLLFDDVYPAQGYVPIHHVGNLPHRVMKFNVNSAEERWMSAKHPLFGFIFETVHPDIHLSDVLKPCDPPEKRFTVSISGAAIHV